MNKNKLMKASALLVLLALYTHALGQESVDDSLNRCAAIGDDSARLDCFDALAELRARRDVAGGPAAPALAPAAPSGPVPITDDVGKERVQAPDYKEEPRFTARVVSCRKHPQSGQYSFSFDNGQVWKQSTYRSLSLRKCEFDVEILRVSFGYDMYIPSRDRTVRITRVR